MLCFICIYFLISTCLFEYSFCDEFIVINTSYGDIKGKSHKADNICNQNFNYFKGIPYAKPPVGDLLFKPPEPVEPWITPLEAFEEGSSCAQQDIMGFKGTNDCLYLNIYTPPISKNSPSTKYLPVMVFIHGGKYIYGSGGDFLYGPCFLMRHNVILVTINYRLGVYGFLGLETQEFPGNAGLKDQVLAMKWIKENIVNFGGDSNKITLFGESAGASSVHLHLLSPLSQGLFQRAIAQSGSATCDWAIKLNAREMALKFANKLNCSYTNDNEMIDCFKNISEEKVIEAQGNVAEFDLDSLIEFSPTVEPLGSENYFLTEHPLKLMKKGKFSQIPFISGMNNLEGLLFLSFIATEKKIKELNNNFTFPHEIEKRFENMEELEILKSKIKNYYFGGKDYNDEMTNEMTEYQTDILFTLCISESIEFHSKYSSKPVYAYLFDYEGERNFLKGILGSSMKGATHAEDLFYLFNNKFLYGNITNDDWMTINTLTNLWTNFADTGIPDAKWMPVNLESNKISYLKITSRNENGENTIMQDDLLKEKRQLWKSYFKI